MYVWHWKSYRSVRGEDYFRRWMTQIDSSAEDKIRDLMYRMATLPRPNWSPKWFKKLKGFASVNELRATHRGRQYRPLFTFGPHQQDLTMLEGAMEVNNTFNPRGAPSKAQSRADELKKHPERAQNYEIY